MGQVSTCGTVMCWYITFSQNKSEYIFTKVEVKSEYIRLQVQQISLQLSQISCQIMDQLSKVQMSLCLFCFIHTVLCGKYLNEMLYILSLIYTVLCGKYLNALLYILSLIYSCVENIKMHFLWFIMLFNGFLVFFFKLFSASVLCFIFFSVFYFL